MNFVALALLEASSGDDENAFWILVGMCDFLDLEVSPPPPSLRAGSLQPASVCPGGSSEGCVTGRGSLGDQTHDGPKNHVSQYVLPPNLMLMP